MDRIAGIIVALGPGLGSSTVGLVLKCNKYRLLEYLYLYLILTFKHILYFTCT